MSLKPAFVGRGYADQFYAPEEHRDAPTKDLHIINDVILENNFEKEYSGNQQGRATFKNKKDEALTFDQYKAKNQKILSKLMKNCEMVISSTAIGDIDKYQEEEFSKHLKDIAALKILIDKLKTIDDESRVIFSKNPNMKVYIREDYEGSAKKAFVTSDSPKE